MEWRAMVEADLSDVTVLADVIYAAHPEDEAIFGERLRLFPAGCFVLIMEDALVGYAITHPWRLGQTPALNRLLGCLPPQPDSLYVHDLALAPYARGKHAASPCIAALVDVARRACFPNLSLTAVNGAVGFWQKHGFRLMEKSTKSDDLASYGDDAHSMFRPLN